METQNQELPKPEPLTDRDIDSRFDDHLNEIYPECKIAGFEYETSRALKAVDPTAYRVTRADWLSYESDEEEHRSSTSIIEFENEYYDGCEFRTWKESLPS